MAVAVAAVVASVRPAAPLALIWGQFAAYLLHEFEEHAVPGGFKDYINLRLVRPALEHRGYTLPAGDFPLSVPAVFWINILFIWILMPACAVLVGWLPGPAGVAIGAVVPWIGVVNGTVHILVALARREYNPGLVMSVTVNVPTGVWTLAVLSGTGRSASGLVAAGIAAVVTHLGLIAWIAVHIRRGVARE